MCSVFEQVFHYAFFVDKDGEHFFFKTESGIDHNFIGTIVLSGLFSWIANIIQDNMSEKLDINIPKPIRKLINLIQFTPSIVKVLKMTDLWWGHLVSDMAGTSSSAKRGNTGMGIPGPFVSFIQTLGVLNPKMAHVADEMFASDKRIDMRQELTYIKGFTKELGKQTVPLIVNETLVRGFYFIRHLVLELQEKQELEEVDWANVIPLGNRTVERMITISTGVFTGIDALDAIVEGAINSKGSWAGFMKNTVLRLNFVGIGRFTVALGNDFYKGYQLSKKNDEVYLLRCKQLYLLNAKVFYKDQQVWQLAENVDESMSELFTLLSTTLVQSSNMIEDAINKIENISVDDLDEQNEGLSTEILDIIS